jgi:sugar (pentulose or hexulose) kinase
MSLNPAEPVTIGIDAGTTAVKAIAIDLSGHELVSSFLSVPLDRPSPERAEQDMTAIWQAVCHVVSQVARQCADRQVVALAVTGQGDGAWLLDADGEPIRPAILWLDGRGADIAQSWASDERGRAVQAATGSSVFAGALPVILAHLQASEPETLRRAAHHLNCKDFVRYKLTGVMVTDASEASRTYLDVRTTTYSQAMLQALGQERFARLLPPVVPPTASAPLAEDVAHRLGLPVGIPVAVGMVDTAAAALGLGVIEPGDGYAIVGTTNFFAGIRHGDVPTEGIGTTLAMGHRGRQIVAMAPMTGAPNLDWARKVTGYDLGSWDDFEAAARQAPLGAGGVTYLPYGAGAGERAPFYDPQASASLLGLSVMTTQGELARAVYEGVALSLRECAQTLQLSGALRLAGGAARSDFFSQTLADVCGVPVTCSTVAENGARGAAACGFVAAGLRPSLEDALAGFTAPYRSYDPDMRTHARYDECFVAFTTIRDVVRTTWPWSRRLREQSADQPLATGVQ